MGGCCGGWGGHWGAWGGLGWIGLLINLALILVVGGGLVALTVWALRRIFFHGRSWTAGPVEGPKEDPKAILKARYARGEITREEYLQMLRDLDMEGGEVTS